MSNADAGPGDDVSMLEAQRRMVEEVLDRHEAVSVERDDLQGRLRECERRLAELHEIHDRALIERDALRSEMDGYFGMGLRGWAKRVLPRSVLHRARRLKAD